MGRDAGAWTGTATLLVTTGSGVVAVDADVAVTAAWLATCTAADADTEGGVVCFVSRGGNLSVSFSSTEAAAAADRDSFEAEGAARKWAGAGTCTAAAAGLGVWSPACVLQRRWSCSGGGEGLRGLGGTNCGDSRCS